MNNTRFLIALLPLLTLSCVESELMEVKQPDDGQPMLVVDPLEINFGIVQPMAVVSEVVTLRNDGNEAVEIVSLSLEGAGFTAASAAPLGWLAAGEEAEFWVDYSPVFVEDAGWITIESSDSTIKVEETLVPLRGQGAYPLLILDPPLLDFGWVEPGSVVDSGITLRNDGLADLTVTQTLVVGADFGAVNPPVVPFVLEPGAEQWMDLTYTPLTLGEHSGSLWVESDTPAGTAQAQLIGGSSDKPIAVCYADPAEIAPLRETTNWMGEDSYDPSGALINEYNWVMIEAPSGATATMPSGTDNRYNFRPDVAGLYTGQLTVYNEFGRASDPCITSVDAIPAESLWIELFWQFPGDDMDLHLLSPAGGLESNNDCYYMNCVGGGWLDWGQIGNTEDDPSLDIDDIPGIGPENINIYEPADGSFQVYVHDFPSSVYTAANEVTVRIYVGGSLAYEDSKTISGEDTYTHFATVEWGEEPVVLGH
jgi:hypothetical protein